MNPKYRADPRRGSADGRIAQLAGRQHGIFSRRQALQLEANPNLIWRRIAAGRWEQMYPGVYRIAGTPLMPRQSLMASCIAWGEGAIISHRSAAAFWEIAGLPPPISVELIVPRGRARTHTDNVIHWTGPLRQGDWTVVDSIPVTTPTRTVLDLSAVVSTEQLEVAFDDVGRSRLSSLSRLRRQLEQVPTSGRPGAAAFRRALDERVNTLQVPQSVLESRLLRLISKSPLPRPVLQHRVYDGNRLVAILDFAFPDLLLAVEADGYRWHGSRVQWQRDLSRRNTLTSLGWRVVHITWRDIISQPKKVIQTIDDAVRKAGIER
jgi:very-short-patch-repair endonuclease